MFLFFLGGGETGVLEFSNRDFFQQNLKRDLKKKLKAKKKNKKEKKIIC